MPAELNCHPSVASPNRHADTSGFIGQCKVREMMLARKNAPASAMVEPRSGIAARDEYALARFAGRLIPQDGNSVSGVFAGNAAETRKPSRTDTFQPNQTDA